MNVGDRVTVEKYGKNYTAEVVKVGRTRFVGRFTGVNGRTYERFFQIAPVTRNLVDRWSRNKVGEVTYHPAA